jgi:predicted metalloprotease with PDZ domain
MPITRVLFLIAFLAASSIMNAQGILKLEYTFTPDISSPKPILHVEMTFAGNDSGIATIVLPTTWAGERDLFKSIQNIHSLDPDCKVNSTASPASLLMQCPPGHNFRIVYDLASDWTGELRHPKEFRVLVKESHLIFNGQNGLVHPKIDQNAQVRVGFRWKNLPDGWKVASSFGSNRSEQIFRGQWHEVYNALFSAGDFRITHLQSAGERLTLAALGSWNFSDQQAAEEILNIFRVEREFWGERKRNSFLVVLAPFDQDFGSSDGTAFSNAFLLYLSRKQTFLIDEKSLLAHEIFHGWNPLRMGIPQGEETNWFTEGFTRYYQDRILMQAKLIDYPQYLERLNKIVAEYWSSPDSNWRGAMIALWVDERIRQFSAGKSSLDERMFSLLQKKPDRYLTTEFLLSVLSEGMSNEDVSALRSFVELGNNIPLPKNLALHCGSLIQSDGAAPYYTLATGQCGVQLAKRIK